MFCHCVRVASRRERSERNDILNLIMTIYLSANTVQLSLSFFSLRPSLTRRCANASLAVACGKPLRVYVKKIEFDQEF
ncbi:hypothetical protein H6G94_03425 [Nostoc punctiforme FACHB-252]|uniref:Uncharacterized protein n=2 Tax=Nostoc punctiforme TaxID=272131 RepID=A0ABR8H3D2_NOSPU|nr:hypothetical protein [Nostoc punctiforme FACHB-252]